MTFVAGAGTCTSTSLSANVPWDFDRREIVPPHTKAFTASMKRIRLIGLDT